MIKEQDVIVGLLGVLFPGTKIYLFGSRARGTNRENSDIDLALDAGRKLSFIEIGKAKAVLDGLYIAEKIDLVDIWSVPDKLRETILREGKIWKD